MEQNGLSFVIPTFCLRDVGATVEAYDEHFWRNGHSVPLIVFDDSNPANQGKYFPLLEQTRTHNDVFYVGPFGGTPCWAILCATRKCPALPPETLVQSALMRIQLRQRKIDAINVPTVKTVPFALSP